MNVLFDEDLLLHLLVYLLLMHLLLMHLLLVHLLLVPLLLLILGKDRLRHCQSEPEPKHGDNRKDDGKLLQHRVSSSMVGGDGIAFAHIGLIVVSIG